MLFHELSGFPVAQFAFGACGAAFGLGGFHGDGFELGMGIENRFSGASGARIRGGRRSGMFERPFQDAMDDEIGVPANGRSEMGVLVETKSEVTERIGRVTSLFERTEHEVGNDAFFGFSGELREETLVMLRSDAQVGGAGKRDAHGALAAVAVRVRASGLRGRGNAAMLDDDFALMEIFDTEGIAEGASESSSNSRILRASGFS